MKKKIFYCILLTVVSTPVLSDEVADILADINTTLPKIKAISAENFNANFEVKPKATSTLKDKILLPEGAKPTDGMESVSLFLNEINVVGLKTYSSSDLQRIIQSVTKSHAALGGKGVVNPIVRKTNSNGNYKIIVKSEVLLSYVYLLSQEITKLYQDNQYFLSRAVIPVQEINQKNGVIEVCAIEGRISQNLTVVSKDSTKDIGESKKLKGLKSTVFNRLKKLTQSQNGALQFGLFERQLLLIRDMPGVKISTTFRQPSLSKNKVDSCAASLAQGAGVTDLSVAIGLDQVDGAVSVDNYGTDATGPWFLRMNFGVNSQIVSGDRYALDVSVSKDGSELRNYGFSAIFPAGSNGTLIKSSFRKGDAAPGASFSPLEVDNKTQTISLGVEHPLKRSRRENASFIVGLKHQNIDTNLLGVQFLKDRIRSFNSSWNYDYANQNGGIHYALFELSKGLDADGATQKSAVLSSRPEAEPDFFKVGGEYRYYKSLKTAERSFGSRLTWVNSLKFQYANEPLFASEEFELGGRNYGRGADIGVISGDRGIALKSQLDYEYKRWGGNVKLSSFIDYGQAWNLDDSDKGTDDEKASLTTAGVSFGFESEKNWYLNLEVSKPVEISGDRAKDTNVYLGLGYRY